MRTPAGLIAVPLLAGTLGAIVFFDRLPELFAFCAAAGALIAWLAALAAFAGGSAAECSAAIASGAMLAGLSLGAAGADRAYGPPLLRWFTSLPPEHAEEPWIVEGTLREDAALGTYGTSLSIDVDRIGRPGLLDGRSVRGGVRLSVAGTIAIERLHQWRSGRRVRVPALLRTPSVYRNPGSPDDRRALARRGVVLVGAVKSGALVEVIDRASLLRESAASARSWARERLAAAVGRWSTRSAAVATAITVGDRTGLSAEDERRLQEAGTYHVIAISGGNIAILTAILLLCARSIRLPPRAAAAVAILALLFYGEVTGAPASVARAIAAAIVYLAGRLLDHRGPPLNALAVAAILAVIGSPLAAADPGFLLSFGATLGILVLAPRLIPAVVASPFRLNRSLRLARALLMLLIATVCAEVALAPLGALLFLRITFAGLLLNFAAIPLMAIVQSGSLGVLATAAFPQVAARAGYATHLASAGLVDSARLVELVPWMSVHVPPPAAWAIAAYYGACIAALSLRRAIEPSLAVAAAMLALMLDGPPFAVRDAVPPRAANVVRVVFLDVAQGDATLICLPGGRNLLVDAGGTFLGQTVASPSAGLPERPVTSFDIGERVVAPAMRTIGVRRLDTLVLTHGDPDHIGGADAVIRRYVPHVVWEGVPVPPFEPMRLLAASAARAHVSWRTVQAGDVERIGDAEIRIVHPPIPDWERQRVRNDDSVVLDVRLGEVSIVLPADIGAEVERAVTARLRPPRTVVLKVPHHGSATSSTREFLDALHPAAAVVSLGRDNHFGHPAPAVIARYRDAGVPLFRTDRDGAVFVETDGKSVWIRGWTGKELTLKW